MALQTAVMNPQFMSFCFPAAAMELEAEKGLERSLLAEADQDFRESTRDLLSFMDSASSNIKLALDKPAKSKRKVNHRKYLQKQIKRCSGMAAPCEAPAKRPAPAPPRPLLKRDGVQASLQTRSLAALFSPGSEARGAKKPPLRHRNLPPSFFTEPAPGSGLGSASGMTLKDLERGNPEAADFLELLGPDYSSVLSEQDPYQRVPGDLGGLEQPACEEAWTSCSRRLGQASRCAPAQVFSPGAAEDHPLCTLSFSTLFADCSLPQATYDPSGGGGYSSL